MTDTVIIIEDSPSSVIQIQEASSVISPVNGVTALDQLTDVNIPNPTEGQVLLFENGLWRAKSFSATDASYEHIQASASDTWTIVHNLNKYPSVTIVDSANDEVEGNVNHMSKTQLVITYSSPFSGKAFLN